MKKSKTKLIIAIIAVVVVIIAIVSGIILYLTTDLFKSNQQLFLKYLAKNDEMIEQLVEDNTKTLEENIKQDKYTTESEITFNLESNDADIANQAISVSSFNIKSTAKADPKNNRQSSESTLKYLDNDLFTLKYIRDNDLYALKSDEVINKYLAFDNNNLKEFAKKLGVTDTETIPNKLEPINLQDLLYISEQDKEMILEKYIQVISLHVSKDKFKSTKNHTITVNDKNITTTEYSLELTDKERNDLLVAILESLKTDDATLNIILSKITLVDTQSTISIEDLKNGIQKLIDDLNNDVISNGNMKLAVYVNNGQLIRTQIEMDEDKIFIDYNKNGSFINMSISFEKQDNNMQIQSVPQSNIQDNNNTVQMQETINNDNQLVSISGSQQFSLRKIEIAKQSQDNQNNMIIAATFEIGSEIVKVSVQDKSHVENSIESNVTLNVNISDNTYFIAKMNSITTPSSDIEVEELTSANSATINKFTPEYLSSLSQAIVKRLQTLFTQKLELVARAQQQATENIQTQNESNNNNSNIESNTANNTGNNTINEATNNI